MAGLEFEGFGLFVGGAEFVDDGGDDVELREVDAFGWGEVGEEGFPGEGEGAG